MKRDEPNWVFKKTKTSNFIYPLLSISRPLMELRFVNAYLGDELVSPWDYHNQHIVVVASGYQDVYYENFEEQLKSHKNYVDSYDVVEGGYFIGHVFKIPEEFLEDFELFLKGKYSKVSSRAQECIKHNAIRSPLSKIIPEIGKTGYVAIFTKHEFIANLWSNKMDVELDSTMEVWPSPTVVDELVDSEVRAALESKKKFNKIIL